MSSEINNSQAANQGDVLPIKLDVTVRPIEPKGNLLGFAKVTINDSFTINSIKVLTGEKGMYVGMPSQQDGKGEYRDVCYPVTADFRAQLNHAVLDGYSNAIEKMQATVEVATQTQRESAVKQKAAETKPSVRGKISENAKNVSARPAPQNNMQRANVGAR